MVSDITNTCLHWLSMKSCVTQCNGCSPNNGIIYELSKFQYLLFVDSFTCSLFVSNHSIAMRLNKSEDIVGLLIVALCFDAAVSSNFALTSRYISSGICIVAFMAGIITKLPHNRNAVFLYHVRSVTSHRKCDYPSRIYLFRKNRMRLGWGNFVFKQSEMRIFLL